MAKSKKRKNTRTKERKNIKRNKVSHKVKKKKGGPAIVYLGLGSNVGDREEYIEQALFLLEKQPKIHVIKHSANIETEPEGKKEQPNFINCVVEIKTDLQPARLLDICQEIEAALGREREIEWGPRTMDIDILLYDDLIYSDDRLQIPHPLMHERMFVLRSMAEIAPHLKHPVLDKSMEELLDENKADTHETYDDDLPGFKEIRGGAADDFERW